jgi:hypothetical protein
MIIGKNSFEIKFKHLSPKIYKFEDVLSVDFIQGGEFSVDRTIVTLIGLGADRKIVLPPLNGPAFQMLTGALAQYHNVATGQAVVRALSDGSALKERWRRPIYTTADGA